MTTTLAKNLRVGQVILDDRKRIVVNSLDKSRCLHHVHVNDMCYDNATVVVIAE